MWAALIAGVFQIVGGAQQAEQIRRQARINEDINKLNAKYKGYEAYEAEKYGYTQAARYESVVTKTIGEQRAGYASQNVDVNFGTAAAVQEESRVNGFLNALDLQKQARSKAYGLKLDQSNIRFGMYLQSQVAEAQAYGAQASGVMNAVNTGVSGYQMYSRKPSGINETQTDVPQSNGRNATVGA
jgi:hypothetical protein